MVISPRPPDISPSVYKPTKNSLGSCISPGLITGNLRYRSKMCEFSLRAPSPKMLDPRVPSKKNKTKQNKNKKERYVENVFKVPCSKKAVITVGLQASKLWDLTLHDEHFRAPVLRLPPNLVPRAFPFSWVAVGARPAPARREKPWE